MSFQTFYLYVLPILIAAAGLLAAYLHIRSDRNSTPPGE